MLRTLFGKVSLALLAIFVLLGALLVSSVDNSARAFQEEIAQKLHVDLAKNLVDDGQFWSQGEINTRSIRDALHMMMVLGPGLELYVISPRGELMTFSDPDGEVLRDNIDMGPVSLFLNDNTRLPIVGDDPRSLSGQKIFSVAPVYAEVNTDEPVPALDPVAYLYIIIEGGSFDSVAEMLNSSRIASIGLSALAIGTVFFLLALLLLFFFFTRPVRRLSGAMIEFRNNNFLEVPSGLGKSVPNDRDELTQLLSIFEEMTQHIVTQFDEMLKSKRLRQEMVTHISHDLKTPLAGVKAYLETYLMRRGSQSDAEALQCIEVAAKNCAQLEHLVHELFLLSRLEAEDIVPEKEAFSLPELVDDIMQKLSFQAQEKGVTLHCDCQQALPFAFADVAQIDRVFTNLLDNAIRHSAANSTVRVRLREVSQGRGIDVLLTDTGSGIPEQDIERLFEPYFKASNRDQHYQQGTGLGLAISRRLLALNGASIEVQSTLGEGTSFRFCIPSGKA